MQSALAATDFQVDLLSPDVVAEHLALAVAASVAVAVVLSVLVAIVYRQTHRGVQYSASFASSLVMLASIGTLVMMVIGDSLARAFGVFGALSLVRFRTAVKDPKDIAYVFLCLAIGMAAGTGRYLVALVGTAMILLVIVALHRLRFGSRLRERHLLRAVYDAGGDGLQQWLTVHTTSATMLTVQSYDGANRVEASWLVTLKDSPDTVITALQLLEGVQEAHLTATSEDLEL